MSIIDKGLGLVTGRTEAQVRKDRILERARKRAATLRSPVRGYNFGGAKKGPEMGQIAQRVGLRLAAITLVGAVGFGGYQAYERLVAPGLTDQGQALAVDTEDTGETADIIETPTPVDTPTAVPESVRPAEEVGQAVPTLSQPESGQAVEEASQNPGHFDLLKYQELYPGQKIEYSTSGAEEARSYVLYVGGVPTAIGKADGQIVEIREQALQLQQEANESGEKQAVYIETARYWLPGDFVKNPNTRETAQIASAQDLAEAKMTIVQAGEGSAKIRVTKELTDFFRKLMGDGASQLVLVGVPGQAVDTLALNGSQYTEEMKRALAQSTNLATGDKFSTTQEAMLNRLDQFTRDEKEAEYQRRIFNQLPQELQKVGLSPTGMVFAREQTGNGQVSRWGTQMYLFIPVPTDKQQLTVLAQQLSCVPGGSPVVNTYMEKYGMMSLDSDTVLGDVAAIGALAGHLLENRAAGGVGISRYQEEFRQGVVIGRD